MEFKACPVFKCLRAEGKKGIYFININAWSHLRFIHYDKSKNSPDIVYVHGFNHTDDAIKYAEKIEFFNLI